MLEGSINCLREHVDFVLVVAQTVSNYGEKYDGGYNLAKSLRTVDHIIEYEPKISWGGMANETTKRNIGIEYAKKHGFTHFLSIDNDEYFEDFGKAKKEFFDSGAKGSIANMFTYFKEPTLRFKNYDSYYVPLIFELRKDTYVGNNRLTLNGTTVICDPTRKPNQKEVVLIKEPMLHFSYVRKNIELKLRNSSAVKNIQKSNIREDYNNAKAGYFVKDFFNQVLIEVPNKFNIQI